MFLFRPDIWSLKTAYHLNVEFSKGAQRCPLMSRSYVRTYIGRALARNLMRKTSCIIPIQHVHTSPYHTYPYYPFTKHQDYWPSTCHMLVQQTSTGSRTAAAVLAVEYEYGNKLRRHIGPAFPSRSTNAQRGCSSASTHLLDRACLKQDPRAQHRIRISTLHFHRQLHAARTLV